MNVILCDRCNNACTINNKRGNRKYSVRTISNKIVNKTYSRGVALDLCDNCYNSLISWISMEDVKE